MKRKLPQHPFPPGFGKIQEGRHYGNNASVGDDAYIVPLAQKSGANLRNIFYKQSFSVCAEVYIADSPETLPGKCPTDLIGRMSENSRIIFLPVTVTASEVSPEYGQKTIDETLARVMFFNASVHNPSFRIINLFQQIYQTESSSCRRKITIYRNRGKKSRMLRCTIPVGPTKNLFHAHKEASGQMRGYNPPGYNSALRETNTALQLGRFTGIFAEISRLSMNPGDEAGCVNVASNAKNANFSGGRPRRLGIRSILRQQENGCKNGEKRVY